MGVGMLATQAQGNGEFITSAGFRLASSNRVARLK